MREPKELFLNSLKQLFVRKESTINLRSNPELETTLVNSVLKGKEFLTLISIGFIGVAHRRWGAAKSPPLLASLKSVTHILQ